jgi:ubiquinone/menaquinone biosynthesis C-methylase UbiE
MVILYRFKTHIKKWERVYSMLSIQDWHNRFLQQAKWTSGIRQYLYQKTRSNQEKPVLDVGCGTGVILNDFYSEEIIHGLDLELDRLLFAQTHHQDVHFICADAHHIPYQTNHFSMILCHFLLLWVTNPTRVIQEMKRVGEPGGAILILAEPDYGGRIDFPESLQSLGEAQTKSLQTQGADPFAGRKLAKWLSNAGLEEIEVGVLGGQWKDKPTKKDREIEWQVLASDLENFLSEQEILEYREKDWAAWEDGSRIMFVPTFFAVGIIP